MTFSNLQVVLSPTLRLSPVMLSLLVNEREHIFPSQKRTNLSLDAPRRPSQPNLISSEASRDRSLSVPIEGSPTLPISSEWCRSSPTSDLLRFEASTQLAPPSNVHSVDTSPLLQSERSRDTPLNYRASLYMVDFPRSAIIAHDDNGEYTSTPIAKKFLQERTASASYLLERCRTSSTASSISPGTSPQLLQRTLTMPGRNSPSPFFSAGAPLAGLGLIKRGSTASTHSVNSGSGDAGAIPTVRMHRRSHRRLSSQSSAARSTLSFPVEPDGPKDKHSQEEEEELSSSDTNTSITSSIFSTATPKDSFDLDHSGIHGDRRATITPETYGSGMACDDRKKNRGSMVLLTALDATAADSLNMELLDLEEQQKLR